VLLLTALRLTLAGSVSLLLNLEMAATAMLGILLFREHLGRSGWLGVIGVVAASAILAGEGGWPGSFAALLTAAACVCWGLDNHLTALIDGITPALSTLAKGAVAGATNLLLGALVDPLVASPITIAAALGVGALSYVRASRCTSSRPTRSVRRERRRCSRARLFIGAALSLGVLGEPLGTAHLAAVLLLLPSIAGLLLSRHEHAHVHEPAEHIHVHRHDDGHHLHGHAGSAPDLRHSHPHRHERLAHTHPHWPDIHHRHEH
jgi:drug/metabolite transporter (DMT)-like permease